MVPPTMDWTQPHQSSVKKIYHRLPIVPSGGSTDPSEVSSSKMTGVIVQVTQKLAKHNPAIKAGPPQQDFWLGSQCTSCNTLQTVHVLFSELVNSGQHESPNRRPGAIKPPI